jgi:hypothetical protein
MGNWFKFRKAKSSRPNVSHLHITTILKEWHFDK